jgi:hypothetical protein
MTVSYLAPCSTRPLPVARSSGTAASPSPTPGGSDHDIEAEEADREHDIEAHARGESAFLSINRGGCCNKKPIFIVVIFGTSEVVD